MVLSMERWKGKVAIVTGASAGIGASIAERLVEEGLQVVGFARREERLKELAKKLEDKPGKFYPIKVDITIEEDILKGFQWVADNLGPVHILINNAGIGRQTSLTDGQTEDWKKILDTNVLGLCICTREAVRNMKVNNVNGHIIHINSILGHYIPNVPFLNVYPAAKHAVTALTEVLRHELLAMESKIKITSISPGGVDTEIYTANGFVFPKSLEKYLKINMKPEDIADAVNYVLSTPPHVQVHELIIKPVGELV